MAGILRTLQSQIFPDTKGPSPEIDSASSKNTHLLHGVFLKKKSHKTCLHKFKTSSNVGKPLASSRVQFVPTEMSLSENGDTVKRPDSEDKGCFSAPGTPGSRSGQETQQSIKGEAGLGLGSTRT